MLLFFLTGLLFEIKRIIIAFGAFVKRENEKFLRKFWKGCGDTTGGGVRAPRPTKEIRIATASARTGFAMTHLQEVWYKSGGSSRRPTPTHRLPIECRRGRRPRRPALPNALLRFVGRRALTPLQVRYKPGGGLGAARPTGGYKRCGKTGRCRHRPLRGGTRSMVQDRSAGQFSPAKNFARAA